ncbi:hypothetical protein EVAR_78374_1 [Eumeta japonica]|uniref:Uncharacterized protein n=1 Tax=Eumeta variegata TaxID=151549 RepID=A0A4C1T6C7_EUMVA|nr:hypothetical protein EVAR_78374_1 [Eumeta japonica]
MGPSPMNRRGRIPKRRRPGMRQVLRPVPAPANRVWKTYEYERGTQFRQPRPAPARPAATSGPRYLWLLILKVLVLRSQVIPIVLLGNDAAQCGGVLLNAVNYKRALMMGNLNILFGPAPPRPASPRVARTNATELLTRLRLSYIL